MTEQSAPDQHKPALLEQLEGLGDVLTESYLPAPAKLPRVVAGLVHVLDHVFDKIDGADLSDSVAAVTQTSVETSAAPEGVAQHAPGAQPLAPSDASQITSALQSIAAGQQALADRLERVEATSAGAGDVRTSTAPPSEPAPPAAPVTEPVAPPASEPVPEPPPVSEPPPPAPPTSSGETGQ